LGLVIETVNNVPEISIITVVKDDAVGLRSTVSSVLDQTFADWKLLIVVGPSIDETNELAAKFATQNSKISVIADEGKGIYPAMNQGLASVNSPFVWFMNAGDIFANPGVLFEAYSLIHKSDLGVVIGGYRVKGERNKDYVYSDRHLASFRFAFTRRGGCHQAMLFNRNAIQSAGGFDEAFTLAADFKLVLKIINLHRVIRVSTVFAIIKPGGASDIGIYKVHEEKHRIRVSELGGLHIGTLSCAWTLLAQMKMQVRKLLL
jgi:glycosyltransferase involved in cell wall biosynthesis